MTAIVESPLVPLDVVGVPDNLVIGIYKVDGKPDKMPARMRRLHPKALKMLIHLQASGGVVVSDMFRSPESSLQAVKEKRGALPPGYSAHGYGLSIDIDVGKTMKRLSVKKKADLDKLLRDDFGLHCHRLNGTPGFEEWHYDFDVDGKLASRIKPGNKSMQPARERMLTDLYGKAWKLSSTDAQVALKILGLYSGEIDGKFGRLSTEACLAFQRTWNLQKSGKLDDRTKRVLWFVAANKLLSPVTV